MHLNRQERVAVLFLTGALLVGTGVAIVDHRHPDELEGFHVLSAAVEVPAAADTQALAEAPRVVSLNRATATTLEQLPQIGPKTAAAIVAHRQAHGPFAAVDDLTAVRGIGRRTVERLRPLVTTE